MRLADRINAFVALGDYLHQLSADELDRLSRLAQSHNGWFTPATVRFALKALAEQLREKNLQQWLNQYNISTEQPDPKKVGLVMPGNVPLEGFHDLLCVLISGHELQAKLHEADILPEQLAKKLLQIEPRFEEQLRFSAQLKGMDAYLAAGNEAAVRMYENYLRHKPHLIRQNRHSCAVLSGKESGAELKALGRDMLQYWGLGSRSVIKLFVPRDYHFPTLFESLEIWSDVQNHHRWNNNYDYHKSLLLVNGEPHLDTGFLLFREDAILHSPVSMVHYQHYSDVAELEQLIKQHSGHLQCIVGPPDLPSTTPFGEAHRPAPGEHYNGVDTLSFLLNL